MQTNMNTLGIYIYLLDGRTGEGVPGARYTLTGEDGANQQQRSDSEGRLRFHLEMNAGYTLQEELPPAGYRANAHMYTLLINEEGVLIADGQEVQWMEIYYE